MKSILVQIILLALNCFIPDPIPFIDEIIQIIILILTIIGKTRKN